jgi:hypothetical protein
VGSEPPDPDYGAGLVRVMARSNNNMQHALQWLGQRRRWAHSHLGLIGTGGRHDGVVQALKEVYRQEISHASGVLIRQTARTFVSELQPATSQAATKQVSRIRDVGRCAFHTLCCWLKWLIAYDNTKITHVRRAASRAEEQRNQKDTSQRLAEPLTPHHHSDICGLNKTVVCSAHRLQ